MDGCSVTPSQPRLRGVKVPSGHVLMHVKHRNAEIVKLVQCAGAQVIFDDTLGIIDFYPSSRSSVVWLREADVVCGLSNEKQEKLIKSSYSVTVLADVTDVSQQYFKDLQKSTNIEKSITVIPVHSPDDVAKFLAYNACDEQSANPLLKPMKKLPLENEILAILKTFSGIGEKKAIDLLMKFGSLENIAAASNSEVEAISGRGVAQALSKFLHGRSSCTGQNGEVT